MKRQVSFALSVLIIFAIYQTELSAQGDGINFSDEGVSNDNVVIEPYERGFGHTIGNGLRRILLSSIDGNQPVQISPHDDGLSISYGAIVVVPTTNSPPFAQVGGGFQAEIEGTRWWIPRNRPQLVVPILNFRVLGQGFNNGTQANQIGGINQTASDLFVAGFQPGFRLETAINPWLKPFLQCGAHVRYVNTNLSPEFFDPAKTQVPVANFTENDWSVGFFAGGGFETQMHGRKIKVSVNFESFNTDVITGVGRQESQIGVGISLNPSRPLTRHK